MSQLKDSSQPTGSGLAPFFTVFTATYNRAHTLHRAFDSLCAQSFRDFEWLVVDDGSTDDTANLIDKWIKTANFPIRYFRQPNSGKHIAHNLAIREARGQFFTVIDSDDALMPAALERAHNLWHEIPETERYKFCGVGGRCRDQYGQLIGDPFPASPFDSDWRTMVFVHRIRGEKWAVWRTDVVRQYPFPEIAGTNWVPEGLVWLQIARTYKHRLGNEVFRIYYVDDEPAGTNLSNRKNSARSALGRLYYDLWLLNHEMVYFRNSPLPFVKAAAMLPVMSRYAGRPILEVWRELKGVRAKLLVLATSFLALPLIIFHEVNGRLK
jgi:glycosyltransferase involved in cell wall biosynthesis